MKVGDSKFFFFLWGSFMSVNLSVTMDSSDLYLSGDYDVTSNTPDRFAWETARTHVLTVTASGGTFDTSLPPLITISDTNVVLRMLEYEYASSTVLRIWLTSFAIAAPGMNGPHIKVMSAVHNGNSNEQYTGTYQLNAIIDLLTL